MLTAVLVSFVASVLMVYLLSGRLAGLAMDMPNLRSLHVRPIPRTGGLGVVAALMLGWWWAGYNLPQAIWIGTLLLTAMSFVDDRLDLPAWLRFVVHGALAGWLAWSLGLLGIWLAISLMLIVWMTNLYNFMDGADGLAGGMTVLGFGGYALGYAGHQPAMMVSMWVIVAAAAGFLVFNFPPARVFMGDAGSVPLGYLAAGMGLLGIRQGAWSWWYPLCMFAPFILDASMTLVKRIMRREKIWQAHRDHYYQRLIRMGWSHRHMAWVAYGLMSASVGLGWLAMNDIAPHWMLGGWWLVLLGLMRGVDDRWEKCCAT